MILVLLDCFTRHYSYKRPDVQTGKLINYKKQLSVVSSLTEKRKREIEEQFAKMKREAERKVLLNVTCDIKDINDGPIISQRILKDIYKIYGVESASYTYGTNIITVIAKWNEISYIVEKIKKLPLVLGVSGKALSPLF
jgi:hypothetical protein